MRFRACFTRRLWRESRTTMAAMPTTYPIGHLIRRGVRLQPHEAVAIAQSVIAALTDDLNAHAESGPPTIETVCIAADGAVSCPGCATPSVFEVGLFLDSMLAHGSGNKVPGALQVLGRPGARRGRCAPVRLRRGGFAGPEALRSRGFAHGRRRPIRARVSFAVHDDGPPDGRDARAAPHDHIGD